MHCNGITSRVNGAPCTARGATQQLPVLGSQDNATALILAAKNNSTGVAKRLIDARADPVVVDKVCCVAMSVNWHLITRTDDDDDCLFDCNCHATYAQNICLHHTQANKTAFDYASAHDNTDMIALLGGKAVAF